jgi:hypothetical protein
MIPSEAVGGRWHARSANACTWTRHSGLAAGLSPRLRRPRPDALERPALSARPKMLVQDLDVRIINAANGELLRQLALDPDRI